MAVLDAWAYGLPVITTPVGGIPDIAKDGENLLLFQPGDCDKLAIQMKHMMKDKTLRNHLTEQSTILSQTIFNIDTINTKIELLYKSLIN